MNVSNITKMRITLDREFWLQTRKNIFDNTGPIFNILYEMWETRKWKDMFFICFDSFSQ